MDGEMPQHPYTRTRGAHRTDIEGMDGTGCGGVGSGRAFGRRRRRGSRALERARIRLGLPGRARLWAHGGLFVGLQGLGESRACDFRASLGLGLSWAIRWEGRDGPACVAAGQGRMWRRWARAFSRNGPGQATACEWAIAKAACWAREREGRQGEERRELAQEKNL